MSGRALAWTLVVMSFGLVGMAACVAVLIPLM